MAKYSVNGSSGSDDDSSDDDAPDSGAARSQAAACELCGNESSQLQTANVAGATLEVCRECSPHDDAATDDQSSETSGSSETDRTREAIRKASEQSDRHGIVDGDSSHWEREGTDYESDPLPYLVNGYGEKIRDAREEQDLSQQDLADEAGVGIAVVRVLETEQAMRGGVAGSDITSIENVLEITLRDDV